MLYVPEIEPRGFFFFYFRGPRSFSLRRYTGAGASPDLRRQDDLPGMDAMAILDGATHAEAVGRHDVTDVCHWRDLTRQLDRRYGVSGPVAASQPAPPVAPVRGFLSHDGRPLTTLADWEALHPPQHWRAGYSARALALAWRGAGGGLPQSIVDALATTALAGLTLEHAVVEHKSHVPGKGRKSCTDLMARVRRPDGAGVVLGVEGKVDESFGPRVAEWLDQAELDRHRANRQDRLDGLCQTLGLDPGAMATIRYQLLHRTYAALATAKAWGADTAVLTIHSLCGRGPQGANWQDFVAFAGALGASGVTASQPVCVGQRDGVTLWLLWVTEP